MESLLAFVSLVAWWGGVIGTYYIAKNKGRNRFGWTLAACLAPLTVLVVVVLLPRKVRMTAEGYHPDYGKLGG
ncbi:MAG: hypothetical protein ACRD2W_14840 [Acidimicrobiales bacterium]